MPIEIQQNVLDALSRLNGKESLKIINTALTRSARILRKEAVSNFKRNGKTKSGRKIKMKTAGLVSISRRTRKQLMRKVHIMKSPLARIFEKGTKPRHTLVRKKLYTYSTYDGKGNRLRITKGKGKGRYTGYIMPIYFFRDARNSKEKEIYEMFNREVLSELQKIWESGKTVKE